jgi:hypothetical protein
MRLFVGTTDSNPSVTTVPIHSCDSVAVLLAVVRHERHGITSSIGLFGSGTLAIGAFFAIDAFVSVVLSVPVVFSTGRLLRTTTPVVDASVACLPHAVSGLW